MTKKTFLFFTLALAVVCTNAVAQERIMLLNEGN